MLISAASVAPGTAGLCRPGPPGPPPPLLPKPGKDNWRLRRLLRKIVMGRAQDLGDTTTLEDPGVVTEILSAYQEYKDKRGCAK